MAQLLVVVGPTGAGKSGLALHLAHALRGEIVNCDSVQVHRGLEIGSAKLSPRERGDIPHHLIDIVDPHDELTAGAYASLARSVLCELKARGVLPIVVGGTGLYLRALLAGLSPAPLRDPPLRARLASLAARRPLALYRFLRRHDPASAVRIHQNDHQKLVRAIEMTRLAREPASRVQSLPRDALAGFRVLKIGLNPPRRVLREVLEERAAEMFRAGLIEETRTLLESGIDVRAKSLQTIGYKQAVEFLSGRLPLDDAVRQCQTKTRQYAKRQMTWFRADPAICWLSGFGFDPAIQAQALAMVRQFLNENRRPAEDSAKPMPNAETGDS